MFFESPNWLIVIVNSPLGGVGGGVLPINGLMGMCRWMGSYFHDWIDYNGVAFLTEFPTELLEWGFKLPGFWG